MSQSNFCRLCVTIGDGYKSLYDESGDHNEVYEITVKYFDPAFLNKGLGGNYVTGICFQCWKNISEFHNFKQSVHLAQSKLIDVYTRALVVVMKAAEVETAQATHDTQSGVAVLVVDEGNLKDKQEFTFSSESNFVNGAIDSDFMDIIEVSLDNIANGDISPSHGNSLGDLSSNGNAKTVDTTRSQSPSTSSLNADTINERRKKPGKIKNHKEFIAEWREKLKCVVCSEPCSSLTVLRKHFLQNHPKEECYVMCCQRKFNHFDLIEDHIRLHINPKSFKCVVCRKCFSNSRILCEHLARRHSEDSTGAYNCPKCKKCFGSKDRRKYHLDNYCTNMCRECCKLFRTEVRRKLHERLVHKLEDPVCKQCGKAFKDRRTFQEHLREHTISTGMHMCDECGKVVSSEWALRCHKRSHEVREIRHKCPICKDIFTGAVPLREHMGIHTGVHTYTCPYCPMTFQYRSRMYYHQRNEHAEEVAAQKLEEAMEQQQQETDDDDKIDDDNVDLDEIEDECESLEME